ncbi:MAG TPA: DUF1569 domain-containing protein [Holophagaceae bacterium]|nr:DUF1569 domain-containing protein [Holophagaceae bacterium]
MMHLLPWPKGVPSGPRLLPEATEWRAARRDLDEVLDRFIAQRQGYADHAAFGHISAKDWGRLMHRHIDWHLRQFGA